ncbi:MAG: carboxymuconolactone decarboxylase family protein [Stagnimonas sp.]|nr:carboxymuconolactone decarboxylase family protein [Stagnimonas sp.]
MSKSYLEITRSTSRALARLRADQPELSRGFSALAQAALKEGALEVKTKELIALALGVAARCDACIGFHVQALIRHQVRRDELEEALGMAARVC